jgi:hypothetical protein
LQQWFAIATMSNAVVLVLKRNKPAYRVMMTIYTY